jgi:hypothetical protein
MLIEHSLLTVGVGDDILVGELEELQGVLGGVVSLMINY